MTEHEMEDLLWDYPELLLREPLKQHRRQPSSTVSLLTLCSPTRLAGSWLSS